MKNPLDIYMQFIKDIHNFSLQPLPKKIPYTHKQNRFLDEVYNKYFKYTKGHGYAIPSKLSNNINIYLTQEMYGFVIEPISALNYTDLLKMYIPSMVKILAYLDRLMMPGMFIHSNVKGQHIYIQGLPNTRYYNHITDSKTGKKFYDESNILFSKENIYKLIALSDAIYTYSDGEVLLELVVDTIDLNTLKKYFKLQKGYDNCFFIDNNKPMYLRKAKTWDGSCMSWGYDLVFRHSLLGEDV